MKYSGKRRRRGYKKTNEKGFLLSALGSDGMNVAAEVPVVLIYDTDGATGVLPKTVLTDTQTRHERRFIFLLFLTQTSQDQSYNRLQRQTVIKISKPLLRYHTQLYLRIQEIRYLYIIKKGVIYRVICPAGEEPTGYRHHCNSDR